MSDIDFSLAVGQVDVKSLESLGVSIVRNSRDKIVNQYGKRLMNVCRHCNIFILNGRSKSDHNGECTCKQTSVVDYCITNVEFLRYVEDFKILPYSAFLSDVHNPVEVSLSLGEGETDKPNSVQESNANRWDPEKVELFHNSVENKVDIIKVLENEIKITTVENVTLEFIDNIVERTGNILLRSAKDKFGEKPVCTNKFQKTSFVYKKPWFTYECKNARQNFRRAKRLYKKFGGEIYKTNLYEKEKLYKKKLKHANAKHRNEMKKKLSNLRSKNPKEYWKILNTNIDKQRCNANLHDLYSFFLKNAEIHILWNMNQKTQFSLMKN